MTMNFPFRFRLRLSAKEKGKFAFEKQETEVALSDEVTLTLVARNADTLEQATNYHLDAGGFTSHEAARQAGERLRVRLRLLNAILALGLNIPVDDEVSGSVSEELKATLKAEHDATIIDSIWGINVFPDDDSHFEYVLAGQINVKPSDPSYVFEGLKALWDLDITLDEPSEIALHILGLATQETSEKAAFLTYYLALEQLIERKQRSELARKKISAFQAELTRAEPGETELSPPEVQSLTGALSSLQEESFSSALARFARSITAPTLIKGVSPPKFCSACISARNNIAHNAKLKTSIPLSELSAGIREMILGLIWTRNKLPAFSLTTPPSAVSIPPGGMKIRVM